MGFVREERGGALLDITLPYVLGFVAVITIAGFVREEGSRGTVSH